MDENELQAALIGGVITDVKLNDDTLLLTVHTDGEDIVLKASGGYCKEVFTELLVREVAYKPYKGAKK